MFVLIQFSFELDLGNFQQMNRNNMRFWNLLLFLSRFNLTKIYRVINYFLFYSVILKISESMFQKKKIPNNPTPNAGLDFSCHFQNALNSEW